MYHVLLGVDEADHADSIVDAVAELPGRDELRVTVFYGFTGDPAGTSATQVPAVRSVTDRLDEVGLDYEVRDGGGDPAEAILSTARERDVDLIVLGGRKRSPAGKALFGSRTQTVVLNADRPVLIADDAES